MPVTCTRFVADKAALEMELFRSNSSAAPTAAGYTEVTGVGIEPGTYHYTPGYTKIDVLGEYTIWKRVAIFANLRNITDVADRGTTVGPSTPQHATLRYQERYGSLWTLGVKGTF